MVNDGRMGIDDGARAEGASGPFELTGGALCLDLSNTVDNRLTEKRELLASYSELVAWGHQAGAIDGARARALRRAAAADPAEAQAALRRARETREVIFAVFAALARGDAPPPGALARLNQALAEALAHLRVQRGLGAGFAWTWDEAERPLDRVAWPAVRSAAELLTGADRTRLRLCADEECGWLFLDRSKNATRRWCDMRVCGNRSKVRRFYERRKTNG